MRQLSHYVATRNSVTCNTVRTATSVCKNLIVAIPWAAETTDYFLINVVSSFLKVCLHARFVRRYICSLVDARLRRTRGFGISVRPLRNENEQGIDLDFVTELLGIFFSPPRRLVAFPLRFYFGGNYTVQNDARRFRSRRRRYERIG